MLEIDLIPHIKKHVMLTLEEDIGISGDITTKALYKEDCKVKFTIFAKQDMVICGGIIGKYILDHYSNIEYSLHTNDSQYIFNGDSIITGYGSINEILFLERSILNYLQHLSGVATLTNKFVKSIKNEKVCIYDTRKTIPGLRAFQKYAVRCGGGVNHRTALDSAILIKDNHISILGMEETLNRLTKNRPYNVKIIVECENLSQVKCLMKYPFIDLILLDNMTLDQIKSCLELINNKYIVEVSGGINLNNIQGIVALGVTNVSIGALTHSACAVDIGLDIIAIS